MFVNFPHQRLAAVGDGHAVDAALAPVVGGRAQKGQRQALHAGNGHIPGKPRPLRRRLRRHDMAGGVRHPGGDGLHAVFQRVGRPAVIGMPVHLGPPRQHRGGGDLPAARIGDEEAVLPHGLKAHLAARHAGQQHAPARAQRLRGEALRARKYVLQSLRHRRRARRAFPALRPGDIEGGVGHGDARQPRGKDTGEVHPVRAAVVRLGARGHGRIARQLRAPAKQPPRPFPESFQHGLPPLR